MLPLAVSLRRMASRLRRMGERAATPKRSIIRTVAPCSCRWRQSCRATLSGCGSGVLRLGKLTLIVSDPGEGKSFMLLDLASRISTGALWPDGSGRAPQGSVVLLGAEDDLADTVVPRLNAAGADLAKIVALKAVRNRDEQGEYERQLDLQRDLDVIEQAIDATPGCRMLGVDPVNSYMGETDTHKNAEVRAVLAPLSELAAKHHVAVVAVHHFRKGEGSAKHRVTGSLAFIAAARAAWTIAPDKTDPSGRRKLFLCCKNNLGPDQSGLAFELTARHSGSVPCIEWLPGPVNVSVDEALSQGKGSRGPDPDEREAAEEFLRDALADGPRTSRDVEAEALEAHMLAKRTLARARKKLGVEAFRETPTGPWMMRLPHNATHNATPY